MKKIIITLSIAALTVAFATQVQAGPKPANQNANKNVTPNKSNVNKVTPVKLSTTTNHLKVTNLHVNKINNYHLTFGTKSSFGYSYKGKHHNHWTVIRFDARYGCNCYWDPCLLTWYYWCDRDVCYYPVSYCPYRCYSCTEVVAARPACNTCTNGQVAVNPAETEAPPTGDNTPIPEPIAPQ